MATIAARIAPHATGTPSDQVQEVRPPAVDLVGHITVGLRGINNVLANRRWRNMSGAYERRQNCLKDGANGEEDGRRDRDEALRIHVWDHRPDGQRQEDAHHDPIDDYWKI